MQDAAKIYTRLVQLVGASAEQIASSTNARVANSKLAYYEYSTGQYDKAALRLGTMLSAYPKNKDYLRRAGLATFAAKQFDRSLPHWRTLVRGTKAGSEEWYEAKYYQMYCLHKTDPEAGKIVYDQFKLLYPTVKSNDWQAKYRELDRLYE